LRHAAGAPGGCIATTSQIETIDHEVVQRQLGKVAASLGKSEVYRKLLLYLTARTLAGEVPKEHDIAVDVFGRDSTFNSSEDAVVRVNVRSLRQRLDEYYRGPGALDSLRFDIPKGAYRVQLVEGGPSTTPAATSGGGGAGSGYGDRTTPWMITTAIACAVAVLASITALMIYSKLPDSGGSPQSSQAQSNFIWAPISQSKRPLTIVLGDLFLFSDKAVDSPRTTRWIRDPEVNSHSDLKLRSAADPKLYDHVGRSETTFLPKSVAYGLAAVIPLLDHTSRQTKVVIADDFDLNDLRDADVVYIGPLSRLGAIGNYYWPGSNYRYIREHLRLEDKSNDAKYEASGNIDSERTDYGLLVAMPGPTGNHLLILSSVSGDIGLLQATRAVTSMSSVIELRKRIQEANIRPEEPFEVLLSASGFARTDLRADIVSVRRLNGKIK
jgi:hypothetical protein